MANRVVTVGATGTFRILGNGNNSVGYNNPLVSLQGTGGSTGIFLDVYNTTIGGTGVLGALSFSRNNGPNRYTNAYIQARAEDPGAGLDGYLDFLTKDASGNTGTPMTIGPSYVKLNNGIKDSSDSIGTNGQILSNFGGTGILWTNAPSGGGSTGLAGVLSISNVAGNTGINMNNQDIYYINSIGNTGGTLDFGSDANDSTILTLGGNGAFKVTSADDGPNNPTMILQSTKPSTGGVNLRFVKVNGIAGSSEVTNVSYYGGNTGGNSVEVCRKQMIMTDATTSSEDVEERYWFIKGGNNGLVRFKLSADGFGANCGNLGYSDFNNINANLVYTPTSTGKFITNAIFKPVAGIENSTGAASVGTSGQVLFSTGSGVQWGDSTLATVLAKGNNAGSTGINMNNQTITNTASIGNTGATLSFGSTVNTNTTLTLGATGSTGGFKVYSYDMATYSNPLLTIQSDKITNTPDGPYLDLYCNNASIGAGNDIGAISFSGNTDINNNTRLDYAKIQGYISNKGAGGNLKFTVRNANDNTITPFIVDENSAYIVYGLRDGGNQLGTNNQVLKSTGSGVSWRNNTGNGSGITYYIKQPNTSTSLTNSTAAQPLFKVAPSVGNTGTITGITAGVWDFEISAYLTNLTTSAKTVSFNFTSTAAFNTTSSYNSISSSYSSAETGSTGPNQLFKNTFTGMTGANIIVPSNTNTNIQLFIKGIIDTSNTINLTPTITFGTNAPGPNGVIQQGSYVKFTNISTTANSSFYVG